MILQLILDSNNKFIGLINNEIDPNTIATEYDDQIIEIKLGDD